MNVWETYSFMEFTIKEVELLIKANNFPNFQLDHLPNAFNNKNEKRFYQKKDVLGITNRITRKTNLVRAFLDAVTLTENFLQELCQIVYTDFPDRIKGRASSDSGTIVESKDNQSKLLHLIITSESRAEMLETIIEEKIRGIFYGNPIDFYVKDKANIGLGNYFKDNHHRTIKRLAEIIARRNIFIHNDGKVDSKYLREVENSEFSLGMIATLNENYVRENIFILRGFALTVSKLVIENAYKLPVMSGRMKSTITSFNREYNT